MLNQVWGEAARSSPELDSTLERIRRMYPRLVRCLAGGDRQKLLSSEREGVTKTEFMAEERIEAIDFKNVTKRDGNSISG